MKIRDFSDHPESPFCDVASDVKRLRFSVQSVSAAAALFLKGHTVGAFGNGGVRLMSADFNAVQ